MAGASRKASGRPARRDAVVSAALRLFERDGFHATGVDDILAEAGTAKMTLYNHFPSKEALIRESLQERGADFRAWFVAGVEERASEPRARLMAIFDVLETWFRRADFNGCLFAKACAEFPSSENPIHVEALGHKRAVLSYIRALAESAEAVEPARLAEELMLLVEGATVMAQASGRSEPARQAKRAARRLIATALAA